MKPFFSPQPQGPLRKDDWPSTVCRICGHGRDGIERLNPDGTCPIASMAHAENLRAAAERMLRGVTA